MIDPKILVIDRSNIEKRALRPIAPGDEIDFDDIVAFVPTFAAIQRSHIVALYCDVNDYYQVFKNRGGRIGLYTKEEFEQLSTQIST